MDEQIPDHEEQPEQDATSQHAPLPFAEPVTYEAPAAGSSMHGEVPLATFGRRFVGYFLDALIVGIPMLLVTLPINSSNGGRLLASALVVAATALYAWLLIANRGGMTLGMKVMSVRCVREVDGAAVSSNESGQRAGYAAIFQLVGGIFIIPSLLDLLWPIWDKKNQTLHDKLARTVVIDARPQPNTINF